MFVRAADIIATTKSGSTSDPLLPVIGTNRSCRHCDRAMPAGIGNKETEKHTKESICESLTGLIILCHRMVQDKSGNIVHIKGTNEELRPRYVVIINNGSQRR